MHSMATSPLNSTQSTAPWNEIFRAPALSFHLQRPAMQPQAWAALSPQGAGLPNSSAHAKADTVQPILQHPLDHSSLPTAVWCLC